ncbi:hypothetical protein HDR58_05615 [bacterium]|nr:hypothetical protein [bacterium]
MSKQNETLIARTVKIPLSDEEERDFSNMLKKTWQKKGGFLRLLILQELAKSKSEEQK